MASAVPTAASPKNQGHGRLTSPPGTGRSDGRPPAATAPLRSLTIGRRGLPAHAGRGRDRRATFARHRRLGEQRAPVPPAGRTAVAPVAHRAAAVAGPTSLAATATPPAGPAARRPAVAPALVADPVLTPS